MTSLSWSNTRITVLEYCQKKYFFSYYSDGLKKENPEIWKETKILRKLKSLEMWMGEMTHRAISMYLSQLKKHILENGIEPDKTYIVEKIGNIMNTTFEQSKNNNYKEFINFGLAEHYYNNIQEDSLMVVTKKVLDNLDAFLHSDYHQKIKQRFQKGHHIYIEDPRKPNFEMMKVDVSQIPGLEEISILAGPDFGIMFGENQYLILDWKSGKEKLDVSGITDQLRIYALKTLLKQKQTKVGNNNIDVYEIYLPSLNTKSGKITQEDIDYIIDKIKDDIEYQKQFIIDQNIQKNEPLDHTNFKRTSHEKKCVGCTFRSVCQKLKTLENTDGF